MLCIIQRDLKFKIFFSGTEIGNLSPAHYSRDFPSTTIHPNHPAPKHKHVLARYNTACGYVENHPAICLRDKSKPQTETDTPFSRKSGYHAVVTSARTLDSCTGSSQDVFLTNIRRMDGRDLEGGQRLNGASDCR